MSTIRPMIATFLLVALSATSAVAADPAAKAPATASEPTVAVPAKQELTLLVQSIRSNRKAMVAASLGLTADQATKFWPLYDEYAKALAPTGDRMAELVDQYIASYRSLSDEKALELIRAYGDNEMARLQIRRSFIDRFSEILPGRVVARFFQIENKMDAVIRYDLAATIPVVEDPADPAK